MSLDVTEHKRTYHQAQSNMELLPNYYAWTYNAFKNYLKGTVVELGSGIGLGIATYRERADHIVAVDYSQELLDRLRDAYADESITTVCLNRSRKRGERSRCVVKTFSSRSSHGRPNPKAWTDWPNARDFIWKRSSRD